MDAMEGKLSISSIAGNGSGDIELVGSVARLAR
jgi:hypothetical protein